MKSTARKSIWTLALGAGIVLGAWSSLAHAAGTVACKNDIDCPEPACGGQVCDWGKGMTCQPAGGAPAGQDGWCTVDSDCKCMGQGAKCTFPYCTFTVAATGSGGSAGTGTGGDAGTGTGGSSGAGTGGSNSTGSGGASTGSSDSGGGCSVAGTGSTGLAGVGVLLGLAALVRRRRSRR